MSELDDVVMHALQALHEEMARLRADEARVREEVVALRQEIARVAPRPAGPVVPAWLNEPPAEQLVTLDQIAAHLRMSKRSMVRYKKQMPSPAMKGKKGRASRWRWNDVRPWLEQEFGCMLPERFPTW
jgi:hypothetical protein